MRTRRTPKAVVGLLTAVAALLLMALPASANPYDAEITSGFLDVYGLSLAPPLTFTLGASNPCDGADSGSATLGAGWGSPPSGWVSGAISSVALTEIPSGSGDSFLVVTTGGMTGTWTAPNSVSGIISASVEVYDVADTWPLDEPPCEIPDDDPCVVSADNIAVTGTYTGTAPNAVTSATISGSNLDFETTVTGPAEQCGVLVAIDNGHVELRNVVIDLT